jgi:hypothetical protein
VWTVLTLPKALTAEAVIAKSFEYALTPEGALKTDEIQPGVLKTKSSANGHTNGHASADKPPTKQPYSLFPPWVNDTFGPAFSLRGLGWKYGEGVYVPPEWRPLDRPSFLRITAREFVKHFLAMDFLETLIKLFPGVGDPMGGTMYYPSLPPLERFIVGTTVHMLSGCILLAGFNMIYELLTLVGVGLLGHTPSSWPPVLDNPWRSESMHELWAKRWHQLLRRTFIIFGGIPGWYIAGNLGMALGTFVGSGFFHEASTYAMGRGFDIQPVIFFGVQGPILILERVWRKVTGRRVGGWPGTLWVWFNMFVCAQPMSEYFSELFPNMALKRDHSRFLA